MDEILATIRRIIADDERATGTPGGAAAARGPGGGAAANAGPSGADADDAAGDDVLELLDALNEDGSLRRLAPGAAPAHPPLAAPASEPASSEARPDGGSDPEPTEDAGTAAMVSPAAEQAGTSDALDERLVSEVTSLAAAAAFARLASAPRRKREPPMVGGRPLDDIVCELLRPLLQAWLDENLPELVERLVQAEIAKISARTGSSSG